MTKVTYTWYYHDGIYMHVCLWALQASLSEKQ